MLRYASIVLTTGLAVACHHEAIDDHTHPHSSGQEAHSTNPQVEPPAGTTAELHSQVTAASKNMGEVRQELSRMVSQPGNPSPEAIQNLLEKLEKAEQQLQNLDARLKELEGGSHP